MAPRRKLPVGRPKAPPSADRPALSATTTLVRKTKAASLSDTLGNLNAVPFESYSMAVVTQILGAAVPDTYECSKRFYHGDHWQDGEAWVGPLPDDGAGSVSETMNDSIKASFVSKNVVREICRRHTRGVVGRPPIWNYDVRRPLKADEQRTDAENATIATIEASIDRWWKRQRVHEKITRGIINSTLGRHCTLRLYIPEMLLTTAPDGTVGVDATTLDDALDYISLDTPEPDQSFVFTEPMTQQVVGIVKYQPTDPTTNQIAGSEIIELTYLDGTRPLSKAQTVVRRLGVNESDNARVAYTMGGRLTMIGADRGEALVDQQVQQQQKALNLAMSMLPRTMITAGFLERIFMDAQMPGTYEYDAEGERVEGSFKPYKFQTGAGTTNFLQGVAYDENDEKTIVKDPKVSYRDPTNPTPIINAVQFHYLCLLEAASQAHIILTGEALVSGASREQARADYDASLQDTKNPFENAVNEMLEAVLAWAEFLIGAPGRFTNVYRAVTRFHIFTGPVSWEERKQNDASVAAGTLSTSSAMQQNGIADSDSEQARILSERNSRIDFISRQAEAFLRFGQGGMPADVAAEIIGLSPAQAQAIKDAIAATPVPNPGQDPAPGDPTNPTPSPTPTPKPTPSNRTRTGTRGQPKKVVIPTAPGKK